MLSEDTYRKKLIDLKSKEAELKKKKGDCLPGVGHKEFVCRVGRGSGPSPSGPRRGWSGRGGVGRCLGGPTGSSGGHRSWQG